MYCKKCGAEISEQTRYCSNCGTLQPAATSQQGATPEQQSAAHPAPIAQTNKYDFLWILLGLAIPLVGIILFAVWKDTKPTAAKYAGIGALITIALSFFDTFILKLLWNFLRLIFRGVLFPFFLY